MEANKGKSGGQAPVRDGASGGLSTCQHDALQTSDVALQGNQLHEMKGVSSLLAHMTDQLHISQIIPISAKCPTHFCPFRPERAPTSFTGLCTKFPSINTFSKTTKLLMC